MKRDILNHLICFLIYFLFITLINKLFSFSYWPLYVGGFIGLFMPSIDHILHVLLFKPLELTSQRVLNLIKTKKIKEVTALLYDTRNERQDLIFHTLNFQIIFLSLTFWVLTSSGNNFGRGLVLGFYLSLVLYNLRKFINKEIKEYFYITIVLLFVFGVMI